MEDKSYSVQDALEAVRDAQKWVEQAQSNPFQFTEAQNHLNYAEQILTNALVEYGNIQERHQIQKASDLLRMLQETQQSLQ